MTSIRAVPGRPAPIEPTTKESLLSKSMRWSPRIGSFIAITLIAAASPARACWEQAARALRRQFRAALRDRPHRIRPRPAGHRPQPQWLPRHRPHADQLRLAAPALRHTASRNATCSTPAPASMWAPGSWPATSSAWATPGRPSVPTTPENPVAAVGLRRAGLPPVGNNKIPSTTVAAPTGSTTPPGRHPDEPILTASTQ
jgi:hypothetical protein